MVGCRAESFRNRVECHHLHGYTLQGICHELELCVVQYRYCVCCPRHCLCLYSFFRRLNITTAYEYLEIRFNVFIRVICSLAFIIFQVGRMGVVLFLPSIALNVVTGLDIFLCIGIMGVCSILYTMIGGIEAVVWTDAIQVIVLLGGAIFAVIYISCSLPGGLGETIDIAVATVSSIWEQRTLT